MKRRDPARHLQRLSPAAREELYAALLASQRDRAKTIGRLYAHAPTRALADVLIDIEADPVTRLEVIRLLRDSLPSGSDAEGS